MVHRFATHTQCFYILHYFPPIRVAARALKLYKVAVTISENRSTIFTFYNWMRLQHAFTFLIPISVQKKEKENDSNNLAQAVQAGQALVFSSLTVRNMRQSFFCFVMCITHVVFTGCMRDVYNALSQLSLRFMFWFTAQSSGTL